MTDLSCSAGPLICYLHVLCFIELHQSRVPRFTRLWSHLKGYNISLACNSPGRPWYKVMGGLQILGYHPSKVSCNPTPDHPTCIPPHRLLGDAGKRLLDNNKPSSVEPFSKHLAVLEQCPLAPILSC